MATVETGNLAQLVYAKEKIFGTQDASASGIILRQTGFDLTPNRNYIENAELRRDGMKAPGRGGAFRGSGFANGQLSFGTYDDLFAAALGNYNWDAANKVSLRSSVPSQCGTLAVDSAAKTITRAAGSFVTDGYRIGDVARTVGFADAGNNGSFVISSVTALALTFSTVTTFVTATASAVPKIALDVRPSFTFQKEHLANGFFFPYLGGVVGGFEMEGKPNAAIELKFDFLTKSVSAESTSSIFTNYTQPNTNDLITSWEGQIKIAGSVAANVTNWKYKFNRNLDSAEVVGSSALYDIQPQEAEVSGSMDLYFDSLDSYTRMRTDADWGLEITLGNGVSSSYKNLFTRCRVKNWKAEPKKGMMVASIDWESYVPTSGTDTNILFTRIN